MSSLTRIQCSVPNPRLPLIFAGALFIIVDDGVTVASDYPHLERLIVKEARRFPNGMACITIVPPNARPPREEIRAAIREAFITVHKHLASVCWHVEGSGFKAAAARAVLSGMVMVLKPSFPSHITAELHDALAWSYARAGAPADLDLAAIALRIEELRKTIDHTSFEEAAP